MRKYFTRGGKAHASVKLDESKGHWVVFSALVTGSASVIGFDMLCDFLSVIRKKDVKGLLDLTARIESSTSLYSRDNSVLYVRTVRQLCAFLKKFPFTQEEYAHDRRATAIEKWKSAEDQCATTNARLCNLRREEIPSWVTIAQRLIQDVLQDLPAERVMKIISHGQHGPGQTLSNIGNRTTNYYKFADLPYTCTKSALSYAYAAISSDPQWMDFLEGSGRRTCVPSPDMPLYQKQLMLLEQCVEIVDHDRVTFVPKDAKTDRPIAVGGSLNIYLQLGVKEYLTSRLKRFGVDLTDQQRNVELAYAGSRYDLLNGLHNPSQFSTIDLASASDTISTELVKLLLPPEWWAFLEDLRHTTGELDGELVNYNKFSAMGNGFTFPLESLIFWAVAKAATLEKRIPCTIKDIAVYGDDIIVRERAAQHVISALEWSGFSVNNEKSFITGPFKESCGADYFRGTDVRPLYLKRRLETHADIYYVCNSFARRLMGGKRSAGASAAYAAALGLLRRGWIDFHPLEETSDQGLIVPLSYMTSMGLRPWLSSTEEEYLTRRHQLQNSGCGTLPVYWSTTLRARNFGGVAKLRMYMSLRSKGENTFHRFIKPTDVLLLEATSSGIVTRRESFTRHRTMRTVPSWDGAYRNESVRHPINWV